MRPRNLPFVITTFALLGCGARSPLHDEGTGSETGDSTSAPASCDSTKEPIYLLTPTDDPTPPDPELLGTLHVLDPVTREVSLHGDLLCPLPSPSSLTRLTTMAMDRGGRLWVSAVELDESVEGHLYEVNPADLTCSLVDIDIAPEWSQLNTGFVYEGETETMYVHGFDGFDTDSSQGLGRVDFETDTLVPIGPLESPLDDLSCRLTGAGDERLFAYCRPYPMTLAEIEPETAQVLWAKELTDAEEPYPGGWAVTFWGGDFYLFTTNLLGNRVSRYRPSDGSFEVDYIPEMDFPTSGAATRPCPKGS